MVFNFQGADMEFEDGSDQDELSDPPFMVGDQFFFLWRKKRDDQ